MSEVMTTTCTFPTPAGRAQKRFGVAMINPRYLSMRLYDEQGHFDVPASVVHHSKLDPVSGVEKDLAGEHESVDGRTDYLPVERVRTDSLVDRPKIRKPFDTKDTKTFWIQKIRKTFDTKDTKTFWIQQLPPPSLTKMKIQTPN